MESAFIDKLNAETKPAFCRCGDNCNNSTHSPIIFVAL